MKKSILIYSIILCISLLSICTMTLATDPLTNPGGWDPGTGQYNNKVDKLANIIVGAIKTIGRFVSVSILVVLGIKYMMGSVEEKAEYKKTMVPYIIGAVLVFSGSEVVQFVYNIGQSL